MKTHFLALVTNSKNEHAYLREWLDYHRLVGVDHFFIYDQDDTAASRDLLAPYEKQGVVTRYPWTQYDGTRFDGPTRFYQCNKNHLAFAHCAANHRHEVQWLMKIDVDEFLQPLHDDADLTVWLRTLDPKRVKGCRIPRIDFGSNGHLTPPGGPVIAAFTQREAAPSNHKDLANGDCLSTNRYCFSSHWWRHRLGCQLRTLVTTGLGWRVNHYYTKSREEFFARQNVCRGRFLTEERWREVETRCNAVTDESMLRFAAQLPRA